MILKIMKKARKQNPGGIYKGVYPPENIFNLSNEEETKISDRHHPIFLDGACCHLPVDHSNHNRMFPFG